MPVNSGSTFLLRLQNSRPDKQSIDLFFQGSPTTATFVSGPFYSGRFNALASANLAVVQGGIYVYYADTFRISQPGVFEYTITGLNKPPIEEVGDLMSAQHPIICKTYVIDGFLYIDVNFASAPLVMGVIPVFVSDGIPTYFTTITFVSTLQSSPQTNVVAVSQPVPIAMIQSSQSGNPIHAFSVDIDIIQGDSKQFNNPFTITRYDLNGNQTSQAKFGVVDPYQYQTNNLQSVPLEANFDGQTALNYALDGLTTVELSFRYVNVSAISKFNWAIRQRIFEELAEQAKQNGSDSFGLQKQLAIK
jgi:hypothetical protein